MPIAFKAALGNNVSAASTTTLAITTTAAIAIGDLVVTYWAYDSLAAATPTVTSVTDTGSNTYTKHAERLQGASATAGSGVGGAILVTKATAAVASGQTITLTLSGAVTAKAGFAISFTGSESTLRGAVTATGGTLGAAGAVSTGASVSANSGDLVIGATMVESRINPTAFDLDTTNGSWAGNTTVNSATGGTDNTRVQVNGQYKIVTAAGTQTFDNTLGAATDWVGFVLVLQATPEAPDILRRRALSLTLR